VKIFIKVAKKARVVKSSETVRGKKSSTTHSNQPHMPSRRISTRMLRKMSPKRKFGKGYYKIKESNWKKESR